MQQERLKQKQQAQSPVDISAAAGTDQKAATKTEQQGRGFKLVLSKG